MNRYLSPLLVAACLQLPAAGLLAQDPGATPDAAPAPATGAEGTGTCIPLQRIESTKVLDDQTILFELRGNETLVNRLPHRCPGLGFEKSFGYKTSISQLCSQDIIWVVTHMGSGLDRGASCGTRQVRAIRRPGNRRSGQGQARSDVVRISSDNCRAGRTCRQECRPTFPLSARRPQRGSCAAPARRSSAARAQG